MPAETPFSRSFGIARTLVLLAVRIAIVAGLLATTGVPASARGALAVGDCGAWGGSSDLDSEAEANARALRECKGKNCKLVTPLVGNCVAFAVDHKRKCGAWGWARRATRELSEDAAIARCEKVGGKDCQISAQICDSPRTIAPALSTHWKSTDLPPDECIRRAETLTKNAGLISNFSMTGESVSGENGDYTAWVRCIAEKRIVIFVVAGPKLEEARRFMRLVYDDF